MPTTTAPGKECGSNADHDPAFTPHTSRETHLGDLKIFRALPIRQRRMVGPWCFLDRFGPVKFEGEKPMNVPPHPHIGLQTVSWLLEGEVLHTDSLNFEAVVRPGGVNVMTAGRGIAHAEETPVNNSGKLNGVQLWAALPDKFREAVPAFTSVTQVPRLEKTGGNILAFAGTVEDITSPAPYFSEILGAEVQVHAHQALAMGLNAHFEHAVFLLEGDCAIEKQSLDPNTLYYLGGCRESLTIHSQSGCKVLLIGGPPFPEKILMWWNFVARTPEEISQARADWEAYRRFGEVKGTRLQRLSAPELSRFAQPNPAS